MQLYVPTCEGFYDLELVPGDAVVCGHTSGEEGLQVLADWHQLTPEEQASFLEVHGELRRAVKKLLGMLTTMDGRIDYF